MALRLRHVGSVSEELAGRLEGKGRFDVLHPSLPSLKGHQTWKRDFLGSSGVFSIRLEGISDDVVDRRLDTLRTFAIGASWGGTRSLVVPMVIDGDRDVARPPENSTYLRVSIGLETVEHLWQDLSRLVLD